MSHGLSRDDDRTSLYAAAARLYESVADQVAFNPQPLPPLKEPT